MRTDKTTPMTSHEFPVGLEMQVAYPEFVVNLSLLTPTHLRFDIKDGPFARTEIVAIHVTPLGNSLFVVSWQESDGATVVNVQDYDRNLVHSTVTLADGRLLRMSGEITVTRPADRAFDDRPRRNRALVLDAMTSLFQRRDATSVDRLYALDYVQHNPSIPQGREALRALVGGLRADVYYEPGLMVAEGDLVAIHGRIRGWSDVPQVVIDLFRIRDGRLAEHWDVLQDEVPANDLSTSAPMFDPGEFLQVPDQS